MSAASFIQDVIKIRLLARSEYREHSAAVSMAVRPTGTWR